MVVLIGDKVHLNQQSLDQVEKDVEMVIEDLDEEIKR